MKEKVKLHLLENRGMPEYVTFGVPYKKGMVHENDIISCIGDDGKKRKLQSYVTAYWPDGSVKWGGYTVDAENIKKEIELEIVSGCEEISDNMWITQESDRYIVEDRKSVV